MVEQRQAGLPGHCVPVEGSANSAKKREKLPKQSATEITLVGYEIWMGL